ncbi:birA bifunctional domain protein [Brucella neotomae 5K33]|nr:birA bifunctional domain protein [Brucella neotomae 5K33]
MSFALSPVAANEGYRLETFEAVGSTNAVALERAAGGDPGKLWLVTKNRKAAAEDGAAPGLRRKAILPPRCFWSNPMK